MTDRSHGKQYTQQIEDIHRHLEDYVNSLDKQTIERQTLLELLEQSELFYDAQYGEAKIVTNVCLLALYGFSFSKMYLTMRYIYEGLLVFY